jgi:hypothetical protein
VEFYDQVRLEAIKTLFSGGLLVLSWWFGQKIVARWDLIKKRRELDILVARDFQNLCGEFKAVSRLWRIKTYRGDKPNIVLPDKLSVQLLQRAAAAEGSVEAITVKLATERVLEPDDVRALGLFRQAYQKLREAIRDLQPFEWTHKEPEYHLYNELATRVSHLVASGDVEVQRDPQAAIKTLRQITGVRPSDWDHELARFRDRVRVEA